MSITFTMEIDEKQERLISEYAAKQGQSMTDFVLEAALDAIEDSIGLRDWNDVYTRQKTGPQPVPRTTS